MPTRKTSVISTISNAKVMATSQISKKATFAFISDLRQMLTKLYGTKLGIWVYIIAATKTFIYTTEEMAVTFVTVQLTTKT